LKLQEPGADLSPAVSHLHQSCLNFLNTVNREREGAGCEQVICVAKRMFVSKRFGLLTQVGGAMKTQLFFTLNPQPSGVPLGG
jgi:hypothetical protein